MMSRVEQALKKFVSWESAEMPQSSNILSKSGRRFLKKLFLVSRPNVALRYHPVASYIKKSGLKDPSILEVGSGSIGITRYLRQKVTGIDIRFSGPKTGYLEEVTGSALELPFEDESFDFAIALDVLEHMPPSDRAKVISEMMRIAKRSVIVGIPSGSAAENWEEKAREFCERKINRIKDESKKRILLQRSNFLREHSQNGLPQESEILSHIQKTTKLFSRASKIKVVKNQSVLVWYMLALGMMRLNTARWLVTAVIATMFLPLLHHLKWGGYYRKLFFVRLSDNEN